MMDHEDYCCRVDKNETILIDVGLEASKTGKNDDVEDEDDDYVIEPSSNSDPISTNISQNVGKGTKKITRKIKGEKSDPKMCYFCGRPYYNQCGLNRHLRKMHDIKTTVSNRLLQCPVEKCYESENTMISLRNHMSNKHSIKLDNCRVLKCRNMEVFEAWKRSIEASTCSKYVKNYGKSRRKDGSELHLYNCHRSGSYVSNGKGIRSSKYKGTSKMGATCPSTISAHRMVDGSVMIRYYPSHVGHLTFLDEMYLTSDERAQVQALLESQVPMSDVYDHIKGKNDPTKDCFDAKEIETLYELVSDQGEGPLIEEILSCSSDSNPIACYQPTAENAPFFLVLMNEIQVTGLRVWGQGGTVLLDALRSNDPQQLQLISLTVVDDRGEAFLCAVCISSENAMASFLEVVAAKVKEPIKANILMTDDDESHVAAWIATMGEPDRFLLSSWHVDALWRRGLSKMRRKTQQVASIYKALRFILREPVESKFIEMTNTLVKHLIDNKYTYDVGQFFRAKFADRVESWAFCKRTSNIVVCDSALESIRNTLSVIFDRGNLIRVIPTLHALLQFIRDQCVNRIMNLQAESLLNRGALVEVSHETSAQLTPICIEAMTDKTWTVKTSVGDYVVFENDKGCPNASLCSVRCVPCDACVHTHRCTCLDSVVNFNVCEHVHLVLRTRAYKSGMDVVSKMTVEEAPPEIETVHGEPIDHEMEQIDQQRKSLLFEITSISKQITEKIESVTDDNVLIRIRDALLRNLAEILVSEEPFSNEGETVTVLFV